jgi:hypothetical protein
VNDYDAYNAMDVAKSGAEAMIYVAVAGSTVAYNSSSGWHNSK